MKCTLQQHVCVIFAGDAFFGLAQILLFFEGQPLKKNTLPVVTFSSTRIWLDSARGLSALRGHLYRYRSMLSAMLRPGSAGARTAALGVLMLRCFDRSWNILYDRGQQNYFFFGSRILMST